MQETKNGWFQLGQVKTESKDSEQAGLQSVSKVDECALGKEPQIHPCAQQSRDTMKCDECGKYYFSKRALYIHKSIVHRGEKPFCCKVNDCNQRFPLESKLGDHKRKEHGYPKLKCKAEDCGLEFSVFKELKSHQNTHQTIIECDECGKSLTQRGLQQHKKFVHQKVKPVECEMADCGKKFNFKSHLGDHMRMVHGFAKLKCNVGECTAEFMSDAVLMKHKKSHFK